jgi:hypothetical protein
MSFLDERIPLEVQKEIWKQIILWETRCFPKAWSNSDWFIISQFENLGWVKVSGSLNYKTVQTTQVGKARFGEIL